MENVAENKQKKYKGVIPVLLSLDFIFILSMLLTQAFIYGFNNIGEILNASESAAIIVSIPGVILGIVCFIYASLTDYVSLKKILAVGVSLFILGSLLGFFFHDSIWTVLLARCLQVAGGQVAGSIFLAVTVHYTDGPLRVMLFGLFTASFQLSTVFGILLCGCLSAYDWAYIFLVPLLSILVLPIIWKNMPSLSADRKKIDIVGFVIFGLSVTMLIMFFNYGLIFLIISLVGFAIFGVYITKAKDPFITPAFFKNTKWLAGILLLLVFWITAYSVTSLFNSVGQNVFGLQTMQVSVYLVFSCLCAAILAVFSGKIVEKTGRSVAIIISAVLMAVGLIFAGIACGTNMVLVTIAFCIYFSGYGLLYSPLTTMVLGTLKEDEMGRGIGMNDLITNVSASVGVAIFGSMIALPQSNFLSDLTIVGTTPAQVGLSNIMFLFGAIITLGLIVFLIVKRHINPKEH